MKRTILFLFAGVWLAGCSSEPLETPAAPAGDAVAVRFEMEAPFETGYEVVPMSTRAVTSYTNWINNRFSMLLLKRIGTQWIVDALPTALLDPQKGLYEELHLTEPRIESSFSLTLTPGHYRIVTILNPRNWNRELQPGTVVADSADPMLKTPPLVTYEISTSDANRGFRALYREVFAAVADFTVPKTSDLHQSPMSPVALKAERRVGKLRFLLKKNSASNTFYLTPYFYDLKIRATQGSLPQGIDALGNTYYPEPAIVEMPWKLSLSGYFHLAENGGEYLISQTNSTIFTPFLYADPDADLTVEIAELEISGQAWVPSFTPEDTLFGTLSPSRIIGFSFEATTRESPDGRYYAARVRNADGDPEDAAGVFDAYFEWNAMSDN